jgi:hypothetical protein
LKKGRWGTDEIEVLRTHTPEKAAKILGRPLSCVKAKRRQLGIGERYWTQKDALFLQRYYRDLGAEGVAQALGRTEEFIEQKARTSTLRRWLEPEDYEFLEAHYRTHGAKYCAKELRIPVEDVYAAARKRGF